MLLLLLLLRPLLVGRGKRWFGRGGEGGGERLGWGEGDALCFFSDVGFLVWVESGGDEGNEGRDEGDIVWERSERNVWTVRENVVWI